ncbi:MAG: hypothetical protein HQ503_06995 [Rhodospirillales bacterium]|nr:hypothetical protein [Rhodospirillales bacterium]
MNAAPRSNPTQRWAGAIEAVLLLACIAGIGALIVLWTHLDSLLAPGESMALVRARILSNIAGLAVPVAILVFLTIMRKRLAALLSAQDADKTATNSAKYMWFLVMFFVIIIMVITANVIFSSFGDINFKQ